VGGEGKRKVRGEKRVGMRNVRGETWWRGDEKSGMRYVGGEEM
jgi:hypothetical protein